MALLVSVLQTHSSQMSVFNQKGWVNRLGKEAPLTSLHGPGALLGVINQLLAVCDDERLTGVPVTDHILEQVPCHRI